MQKRFFLFVLAINCLCVHSLISQQAIGEWSENLSYRELFEVVVDGDLAFATSGQGLFSYDLSSGHVSRFSKVNGLSDVGIRSIAFDASQGILLVGYSNGNIDMIRGEQVDNISDIKRSNIIGDLGINDIMLFGEEAWLSCGFGIVVLDLLALEVKDTYIIGEAGSNLSVHGLWIEDDQVFAATQNGIKRADRANNLADFTSWSPFNEGLTYPDDPYGQIKRFQGQLFTFNSNEETGTIFKWNDSSWEVVPGSLDQEPKRMSINEDKILFTYAHHFNLRDSQLNTISDIYSYPFDNFLVLNSGALTSTETMLLADQAAGLVIVDQTETNSVLVDGPYTDVTWNAAAGDGELWIAHGELKSNFDNVFNNDGFSGFDGSEWRLKKGAAGLENVRDIVDVAIDPIDPNKVYFASFLGGLVGYDLNEDLIEVQNSALGNSPLEPSLENPDRIQSGSLAFDNNGNLWVTNSYTEDGWKILKRDGDWESMSCPTEVNATTLYGDLIVTESGQTWTILPRGNGLVVLEHGNEITTTSSHPCKKLSTQVGEGGLPTNTTLSIAEDLDGEIWVGTSEGPVVNYNPQSILSNNPTDFQPILVERDGNVERLLGSESITAIEIDGANRKWLGTLGGGAFLLSEDGTEEILHFTEENSPLFSNVIRDIAIDQSTGTVHFLTNAGTISYKSDATNGQEDNDCFDVYPNPVRPDYFGPIAIDGLKAESEVKITDVAGNIVFQMVANGGRAVWQGTDFSGNRVSTGVYFALVSDREGESSCISKILFIN